MTAPRIEQLAEGVTLCPGDCRAVLEGIAANSFDACVTDPPYGLGFMGKGWDHGVPDVDHWRAIFRVLKPGAHLAAFGGTRTFGRLWIVIEEAGFEIRDTIMWVYGSGFPKSLDVSKAIDKAADYELQATVRRSAVAAVEAAGLVLPGNSKWDWTVGEHAPGAKWWIEFQRWLPTLTDKERDRVEGEIIDRVRKTAGWFTRRDIYDVRSPALAEAETWYGYGTALKPAVEPIILARKPLEGTVAANVLKWGTGALNIDGCRVSTEENLNGGAYTGSQRHDGTENWGFKNGGARQPMPGDEREGAALGMFQEGKTVGAEFRQPLGRWPANLIHDGSDEVVGAFPETKTGTIDPSRHIHKNGKGTALSGSADGSLNNYLPHQFHEGDSGSAARFFYQVKKDTLCGLCCLPYQAETDSVSLCNANNVEPNLSTGSIHIAASVLSDVAGLQVHESAGSASPSNGLVNNAENPSSECHPQNGGSALPNVEPWPLSRIVQNVSAAASLCASCATDIARTLAEVRQGGCAVPVHFSRSTSSFKEKTLSRSLASYVAQRESTDTILTTANLSELFGCVFHAIAEHTSSERSEANTRSGSKHLFYSSKADSDDRLGSKHPTVKPLDLMQYLVRLVTPKGGTVFDPFAGTGTTGEAAFREGMKAVLIEREEEYQNDIRRRMRLAMAGPDERKREGIKARHADKPADHGPLFA